MNKLISFLWLFFAIALSSTSTAEETISHSVAFPKGDAAWTIKLEKVAKEKSGEAAHQLVSIQSIDVVQKGDLRRDLTHWSDGSTSEAWWIPKLSIALMQSKLNGDIRGIKISQLGPRRFDSSSFAWIGAQNFQGIDTFKGRKVQRYTMESPLDDGTVAKYHAMIEEKSGTPVAVSDDVQLALFAFDAALPKEPLILPSAFQEALRRYESYYAPAKKMGKR